MTMFHFQKNHFFPSMKSVLSFFYACFMILSVLAMSLPAAAGEFISTGKFINPGIEDPGKNIIRPYMRWYSVRQWITSDRYTSYNDLRGGLYWFRTIAKGMDNLQAGLFVWPDFRYGFNSAVIMANLNYPFQPENEYAVALSAFSEAGWLGGKFIISSGMIGKMNLGQQTGRRNLDHAYLSFILKLDIFSQIDMSWVRLQLSFDANDRLTWYLNGNGLALWERMGFQWNVDKRQKIIAYVQVARLQQDPYLFENWQDWILHAGVSQIIVYFRYLVDIPLTKRPAEDT